jgi:hypothetical protein
MMLYSQALQKKSVKKGKLSPCGWNSDTTSFAEARYTAGLVHLLRLEREGITLART